MKRKLSNRVRAAIGLLAGISIFGLSIGTLPSPSKRAIAQTTFQQQEIPDQGRFVAVAAPVGDGSTHKLVIFEQRSDQRLCWDESGSNPTIVIPLLLTFDFTGICGRSIDSNGFSMRMAGNDMGLTHTLSIIRTDTDMLLMGVNPLRRRDPAVEIGRTNGITTDFAKITLNPGWRFARRAYEGQPLGHVYLANDRSFEEVAGAPAPSPVVINPAPRPSQPTQPTQPTVTSFPDITGDIYRSEIEGAIARGFVGGFPEDNTFRPLAPLTREQLVSLVLSSLDELPGINLPIPAQAAGNPYPDVAANRWSAAKIQFARDVNIVSGYQDGTFQPEQTVTRAELIAVLRRAAEYGKALRQLSPNLTIQQAAFNFSDVSDHWAATVVSQMSAYCRVATPLNEQGNSFFPNQAAQRNYAASATLRMLQCVEAEQA